MSAEDLAESTLLKRREFMGEYRFADSTERRGRAGEQPWPPHLVIGKTCVLPAGKRGTVADRAGADRPGRCGR